jgi:hypothetical protein
MSEEMQLSQGMLVTCRVGEKTKVGPCRVVFVGDDYVTVEDPDQKMWQIEPTRVEPANDQLAGLLSR